MSDGHGFTYDGSFPLAFLVDDERVGRDGDEPGRISVSRTVFVPDMSGEMKPCQQSVGYSLGDLVVRDWQGTLLCIKPYGVPHDDDSAKSSPADRGSADA